MSGCTTSLTVGLSIKAMLNDYRGAGRARPLIVIAGHEPIVADLTVSRRWGLSIPSWPSPGLSGGIVPATRTRTAPGQVPRTSRGVTRPYLCVACASGSPGLTPPETAR
jgi:hypothetical protein